MLDDLNWVSLVTLFLIVGGFIEIRNRLGTMEKMLRRRSVYHLKTEHDLSILTRLLTENTDEETLLMISRHQSAFYPSLRDSLERPVDVLRGLELPDQENDAKFWKALDRAIERKGEDYD